jgi:hypothetical protein
MLGRGCCRIRGAVHVEDPLTVLLTTDDGASEQEILTVDQEVGGSNPPSCTN